MTKARCEGQPRASEAKGPLPAEEGWVMEKKKKRKEKEREKRKEQKSKSL
jgi:hypothetical protein